MLFRSLFRKERALILAGLETFIWILSQLNTKTVLPGTRFYSKSSFHFIPIRHYPIVWSFVLVNFGEFSPKVFRKALIYLSAKLNPYKMKEKSPFLFFSENVISLALLSGSPTSLSHFFSPTICLSVHPSVVLHI